MLFLLFGCQGAQEKDQGKLNVLCTTGMIADLARNAGGEHLQVRNMMGPGVDPHLYKASQGDLKAMRQADLILYNGHHLEGKLSEILGKMSQRKPVVAVTEDIPEKALIPVADGSSTYDPHLWFDVSLWNRALQTVSQTLQAQDSSHQSAFRQNTAAYADTLEKLHHWVDEQISTIPAKRRVLVTAHDAFSYFGKAYDIEVRGLQGISTLSEYGLKDVTQLVDFLSRRKIKAVFVESSVPKKSLEAVVEGCHDRGHQVKIGGTLYSDAMGPPDSPAGTYPGMVRHNVRTIVQALK